MDEPPLEVKIAAQAWRPFLDKMELTTKLPMLQALCRMHPLALTPEMVSLSCALMLDPEVKQALDSVADTKAG